MPLPNGVMPYIIVDPPEYCHGLSGCQMSISHLPVKDSIPRPEEKWRETIDYTATHGNKVCVTGSRKDIPLDDPLSVVPIEQRSNLDNKQVLIVRDDNCGLIISFADREKEKELFGADEEARGLDRVRHCIPEVYREMQRKQAKEGVKT